MGRRLYKSGTDWCFWRWTDVDNEFITRLHVIKTPWFAICLHWIRKPDPEPFLHDHPVSFLSIVLRGEYTELRCRHEWALPVPGIFRRRWFNWVRAAEYDQHTIISSAPHTLTLCLMGPKRREWGYHTPDGWVHWKKYSHEKYRSGNGVQSRMAG